MAFDPFGDYETRGYLRNYAGARDPKVVKEIEHASFRGNVKEALEALDTKREITFDDVRDTHRTLFKDVYPWAGESRDQNAANLNITKGPVTFQPAPYVPQGVSYALQSANDPQAFRADPGNTIGELAYAHPFLDGNGRTITTVMESLARKANFHIEWEKTNKADYLAALTREIDDPGKGHLTKYLEPHIRDGARSLEDIRTTLTRLPGLSAPEQSIDPGNSPETTKERLGASNDRPGTPSGGQVAFIRDVLPDLIELEDAARQYGDDRLRGSFAVVVVEEDGLEGPLYEVTEGDRVLLAVTVRERQITGIPEFDLAPDELDGVRSRIAAQKEANEALLQQLEVREAEDELEP